MLTGLKEARNIYEITRNPALFVVIVSSVRRNSVTCRPNDNLYCSFTNVILCSASFSLSSLFITIQYREKLTYDMLLVIFILSLWFSNLVLVGVFYTPVG